LKIRLPKIPEQSTLILYGICLVPAVLAINTILGFRVQPAQLLVVALVCLAFLQRREVRTYANDLVRRLRSDLSRPVAIFAGRAPATRVQTQTRADRRSRTWTIIATWAAAIFVVCAYIVSGGSFMATIALAGIAGLYWSIRSWRMYTFTCTALVVACGFPMLISGDPAGSLQMACAAVLMFAARSRRSFMVAMSLIVLAFAFRAEIGLPTLAGVITTWLFRRKLLDLAYIVQTSAFWTTLTGGASPRLSWPK